LKKAQNVFFGSFRRISGINEQWFAWTGQMVANLMKKLVYHFRHREDNAPIDERDQSGVPN
jgi:hypothetical protein